MSDSICGMCGAFDHLHDDEGNCPQVTQGLADPPSLDLFPHPQALALAALKCLDCQHNVTDHNGDGCLASSGEDGTCNCKTPRPSLTYAKRKPGRPKGTGGKTQADVREGRLSMHNSKIFAKQVADVAQQNLAALVVPREYVKRQNCPQRTVSQAKDAALQLINQQLWNLEGISDTIGLTAEEENRALKLLAGLNAALPKTAEEPPPKPVSQMTDAELAALDKK